MCSGFRFGSRAERARFDHWAGQPRETSSKARRPQGERQGRRESILSGNQNHHKVAFFYISVFRFQIRFSRGTRQVRSLGTTAGMQEVEQRRSSCRGQPRETSSKARRPQGERQGRRESKIRRGRFRTSLCCTAPVHPCTMSEFSCSCEATNPKGESHG